MGKKKLLISLYSVLEQLLIKGSNLYQRLQQHESKYPIGLKSARIEIPSLGPHYIDFSKTDFYQYKKQLYINYIQMHFI